MPNDDRDDYGRARNEDHLYATVGNGPAPPPPPSPIEKVLLGVGMDQRDAKETSEAVVKLMGKMIDDPLPQQQKMVQTFMGRFATEAAVEVITDMAVKAVKPAVMEAAAPKAFPFEQVQRAPAFTPAAPGKK